MSLKNDLYTYRVTWSDDDGEYVGLCAEFPSSSWLAKTPEVALKDVRKVVAVSVEDMNSTVSLYPPSLRASIIAVNLWYVFPLRYIDNLLYRQTSLVSA